jgi:Tfp pilus assembly protein PilN
MFWKVGNWWDKISDELLAGASGLGVYLDQTGLTVAHVQKGFSRVQVRHLVCLPLAEGGLENLTPDLQELISQWGLQYHPVSLAVSRELGFLRSVVLPQAAAQNLSQVVTYELDRFLPLAPKNLYFDFQVLQNNDSGIELMLMALPREPVERCLNLLTLVDLRPISLELAPTAAANAFALLGGKFPSGWLLLRSGQGGLELTYIQGRTLRICRVLRLAPEQEHLSPLMAEINRIREQGFTPASLCLSGNEALNLDLESLSGQSNLSLITPADLQVEGLPSEANLEAAALPALGAALRGVEKVPLSPNLLPEAERSSVKIIGFFLTKLLLVILLGLFCLWLGSVLLRPKVALYRIDRRLARLGPEAKQVAEQMAESQAMAQQLQSFRLRLDQYPNKLGILTELTKIIPEHTWLFHLQISQQHLEISGTSDSAADLIPKLEQSGLLTQTEFVSPIVTDANGREHFKIKAEIKGLGLGS